MTRLSLTCTVSDAGPRVQCGQPAVIAIVFEQFVLHAGDVSEDILTAYPVCADHAPEEVHEARCSMDESEFLVLDLPTPPCTDKECDH